MADTKITALAAITTVDPAADVLPIVDVSDTSMAASGTTKKITSNQLLGSGGTATLASATITGDLTVDTSTLKVDSTNNRVGIGTASPAAGNLLHISGTAAVPLLMQRTGSNDVYLSFTDNSGLFGYFGFSNGELRLQTPGSSYANKYVISSDGTSTWSVAGTTAMTLNSTGLGIGATPAERLTIGSTTAANYIKLTNSGATTGFLIGSFNTSVDIKNREAGTMNFFTSDTQRMQIDSSGNVGIGVTPSAWNSSYKAIEFGSGNALMSSSSGYGQAFYLNNAVYNTSGNYVYKNTQAAGMYQQNQGAHQWFNAPSGTAGNTITFTQAMTLDASGNLLVATTTANGRIAVDADLAVYNGISVKDTGTAYGAGSLFMRFINSSGATAGSIQHTAVTTTNYNTASDARLKESKGIATDTSVIDNTIIHDFIWKADGSVDRGVFAQEAQPVKPRAVSVGTDDLTEDGNIKTPWSVDYSKYVPDLIVYCQQLKKQVKELTARVQTLEAK